MPRVYKPADEQAITICDEYYQLPPKQWTLWGRIRYTLSLPLRLPRLAFSIAFGRLLSYVLFNPLFRREEKAQQAILPHPTYPEPDFLEDDALVTIDVAPPPGFIQRTLRNYLYHASTLATHSALNPLKVSLSKRHSSGDKAHLYYIIGQIAVHIMGQPQPEKPNFTFKPQNVYLKGLAHLKPEVRQELLTQLVAIQEKFPQFNHVKNQDSIYYFTVKGRDGAELDSVEVCGEHAASRQIDERRFVVSCMPRSNNYQAWMKQFHHYAKRLDATVIGFNYRGIANSRGLVWSQDDMVADAITQVERLIALGANPGNIALDGECLGGAIATLAAAKLHQQGYPVKLYSARSFRSTTRIIAGRFMPTDNSSLAHPKNWLRAIGVGLVYGFIAPLLYLAGWELNAAKAYQRIPKACRDFSCVHSTPNEPGANYQNDPMVPHSYASIYSVVEAEQAAVKKRKAAYETLNESDQATHDASLTPHRFRVGQMRNQPARVNGHTCQPRFLVAASCSLEDEGQSASGRDYKINALKRLLNKDNTSSDNGIESVRPALH